ncbi:MAG: hypothetical protein FD165_961 [Gammaproteobacteria bacterium]|nr:MAG: hypothetical protein FD165_961 [Gammaproteobacteria bacterium]TND06331.1 MAG: hypothetical protein FD120_818 [Gammaproteobacteria bacterium]
MISLFEFPCQFPLKVMGKAAADFDAYVVEIVRRHVPGLTEGAVRSQLSRNGNYVSITVTFEASSQEQLDALYRELTGSDRTLMVL